jgi:5'-3' exoribonuclease 2
MGVPAFFRWLTVRYPQVVIDALSEEDLQYLYADYTQKPAGRRRDANEIDLDGDEGGTGQIDPAILIKKKIEENNPSVDNLYLDMNGIIHPCCHPLDRPAPTTEVEMFNLIFEYVDRVVAIVQPAKTLYLAIDGVAPRAKMNQQRSRRFRTAIDAQDKADRTS